MLLKAFDFDGTLVEEEMLTGMAMLWYYIPDRITQLLMLMRFLLCCFPLLLSTTGLLGCPEKIGIRLLVWICLRNVPVHYVTLAARDGLTEWYLSKVRPSMLREIQSHSGPWCIVTGNIRDVVVPVGEAMGAVDVMGTRAETRLGVFTGAVSGNVCVQASKRDALLRMAATSRVCMYGNSKHDIPSMQASGEAVAVFPDRCLRNEAKRRGWRVVDAENAPNIRGIVSHY